MDIGVVLSIVISVLVFMLLVVWVIQSRTREERVRNDLIRLETKVENSLSSSRREILNQLSQFSQMLEQKFRTLQTQFSETDKKIYAKVQDTQKVVQNVKQSLGALQEMTKQIIEISRDMSELQDLLKPPKLRGELGEFFLEELLKQILPPHNFKMQYRFKDGSIVDAAIFLPDNKIVPVDAKFPQENLEKSHKSKSDAERERYRKQFLRDVRTHIKSISQKYIRPTENTLNFAFMYIPAEAVYYEAMVREENRSELFDFSIKNRVIPVSPNTFYSYLVTVVFGLKGFQLEKRAEEILRIIQNFQNQFSKIQKEFSVLGTHLENASKKYDDLYSRLRIFGTQLKEITEGEKKLYVGEEKDNKGLYPGG